MLTTSPVHKHFMVSLMISLRDRTFLFIAPFSREWALCEAGASLLVQHGDGERHYNPRVTWASCIVTTTPSLPPSLSFLICKTEDLDKVISKA